MQPISTLGCKYFINPQELFVRTNNWGKRSRKKLHPCNRLNLKHRVAMSANQNRPSVTIFSIDKSRRNYQFYRLCLGLAVCIWLLLTPIPASSASNVFCLLTSLDQKTIPKLSLYWRTWARHFIAPLVSDTPASVVHHRIPRTTLANDQIQLKEWLKSYTILILTFRSWIQNFNSDKYIALDIAVRYHASV